MGLVPPNLSVVVHPEKSLKRLFSKYIYIILKLSWKKLSYFMSLKSRRKFFKQKTRITWGFFSDKFCAFFLRKRLESVWNLFISVKINSKRILLILKRNICQIFISNNLREKRKPLDTRFYWVEGEKKSLFLCIILLLLSGIIIICEKRSQKKP
jgi:hypothetical protein